MSSEQNSLDLIADVVQMAQKAGADSADALYAEGVSLSLTQRMAKPEHLERSEGIDIGLRVFVGVRQAIVSSSDVSKAALEELVDRGMAMARVVPEDPYCGIASPDLLADTFPDLDECDPVEPTADDLADKAAAAEDAARSVSGVTNSEGAEAGWSRTTVAIAASNGFARQRAGSGHSLSVSVLAGEGTAMESDYDYAMAVHGEDLPDPETIGRNAGEQVVRRLNPRKAQSAQVPIVYDPRVAGSLLGHLAGAINGSAIARETSFLKDKLGETIFSSGITITDDPLRVRGLRSKSFDGEGVVTARRNIIDDGVLTTWILDLRSARQLNLETTGHAARGTSSPPSPSVTNFHLEAGAVSPEDIISGIDNGLYVTSLIGMGVNGVTGDYSRGASGFWIENGELAYPVSEVTIAGNLVDMFANITPANDLEFRYGINSPTVRVDGMTVAGK
jgi:PmbA protein